MRSLSIGRRKSDEGGNLCVVLRVTIRENDREAIMIIGATIFTAGLVFIVLLGLLSEPV